MIYRVAQEALTNVARHAGAGTVAMTLADVDGAATLTVDDDGRGVPAHVGREARGITGMRERALLVRGRLTVSRRPAGGAGDAAGAAAMSAPATTSVLVADDHAVVRHGVRAS